MRFSTIDVETANADMSSICQIGIAQFSDGRLVGEWASLIDPEDEFDAMNIAVHGIEPRMVRGKPKLPDVADLLREHLQGTVSVCHTHFDRVAIAQGFAKYQLESLSTSWLDSARVVRRTWSDLAWSGYGLANVCSRIGYEFKHHDALEDAKAAGYVLLAAMRETNRDLAGWLERVAQPIVIDSLRGHRDGNPEGDLYGEVVAFTGALELVRREAADLAASIGCKVEPNVTKNTTMLVVGDQDVAKLAGHEKSSKHRKAEMLAAQGQRIRIMRETDFKLLVQNSRHS